MTVSTTIRKAGPFAGTGLVSSYPFTFKVFTDDDLLVIRTPTGGADVTLVLASDYTVTLNPDQDDVPGGSVVLSAPLAVGYALSIGSQVDSLQGLSLTNNGGFFPKAIENALDKLDIQDQQLEEVLSRALRLPFGDGSTTDLPSIPARKGKLLSFNAGTGAVEAIAPADGTATALAILLASKSSGEGASQVGTYFNQSTVEATLQLGCVNLEWYAPTSGNDYTTALASAVATGKNVYVPWRSATRTITAGVSLGDNQVVFSDSPHGARIQTLTTLSVIFNINGKTGAGIKNLWLEGPGATSNIAQSYTQSGVFAQSVSHCFVEGCRFSGWAGGAVFFQDATACRVVRNTFTDAQCMPTASDNFGTVDITFWKSCVDNVIAENIGESGASYHVILQTVTAAAQTSLRNKIINNTTTGNKVYGIMVYNILASTHVIESTIISGNTVRDVAGFYNNPASGLKDYGAGIYLLSAEKTVCTGNIVENTCTATAGSTLTPAAISANGISSITISNNRITTSAWYGIWVTDTLQIGAGTGSGTTGFIPSDFTVIEGNVVKSTTKHGIYIRDKHKVRCSGNTVDTVSGASMSGIVTEVSTANYPTLKWVSVTDNSVYGFTTAGILSGPTTGADISGNQIDGSAGGTTGIFAETTDGTLNGNNVRAITSGSGRGFDLRSTGANSMIAGNTVTGCTLGILAGHRVKWGENDVRSNTTDWSGAWVDKLASTPILTFGALRGDRVRQLNAAAGSPKAWTCTVASASTTGGITAGTNTLTLAAAGTFANGQGITVAGAGAAGAALNTTITSGGGTVNLVLVANAGTTVVGAAVTHAGTWVSEGNL